VPDLEPPIEQMIEATNRGDRARLLAAFADDAVLIDTGRAFKGKAEIARWDDDENIGTLNQLRVIRVKRSAKEVRVDVSVTGKGYNGPGTLAFQLEGESIKRLIIT